MALSMKIRLSILGLVVSVAIGGFLVNQIAIEVEIPGFDLNKKDVYLFSEPNSATYMYQNGTRNSCTNLILDAQIVNSTHTNVSISVNGNVDWFWAHPNGTVYQDGKLQGNYSIWWIYIPNQLITFGVEEGETFNAIDPTGFLGSINSSYILVIDKKMTYWPSGVEVRGLAGAQASIQCSLWDKTTNQRVSDVLIDITCGMIERWEGARSSFISLTLTETTFPISRNRELVLIGAAIIGPLVCILAFLLLKHLKKAETIENKQREEVMSLMILGVSAIILEIVDIWFYLYPKDNGMLLLHLGFIIGAGFVCWRLNYGFRWLVPAILEVAFVFTLSGFTGDPIAPSITAFMGSMITWLCMLWASGITKQIDDDLSGGKKIMARIF